MFEMRRIFELRDKFKAQFPKSAADKPQSAIVAHNFLFATAAHPKPKALNRL